MEAGYPRVNAGRVIAAALHCGEKVSPIDEDPSAVPTHSACTELPGGREPPHLSRGAPDKCTRLAESQKRWAGRHTLTRVAPQVCDDPFRDAVRETIQQLADQPECAVVRRSVRPILSHRAFLGRFRNRCRSSRGLRG